MSAFMCSDAHISALATYATTPGLFGGKVFNGTAEECAAVLRAENEQSLWARYPRDADEMFGAPFTFDRAAASRSRHAKPVEIIKSANCFAYQACEHDGWETSLAHKIINSIIDRAISRLPGYEDARWGEPGSDARKTG